MIKRIQVIINPAAGQAKPVLQILNSVFKPADIAWDVSFQKTGGNFRSLC
jgi:hypothetical protein